MKTWPTTLGPDAGRRKRQEGQVLVLFAMSIVVIMLFASIVIDLGVLRNNRQILVNAVDAGALAGGTVMPVDACNNPQNANAACTSVNNAAWQAVLDLVADTIEGTYPGIPASAYTISFRCLIGVDSSSQPYVSRDVPLVCNPRGALGHAATAADFRGAGATRYSDCNPRLGDKCNVVVVTGAITTSYSFGRVVGVNEGSTGSVVAAACNGPCGQAPAAPVDLVVIVDRTASMSSTQITNARDAAKSILQVYDPSLQRVALGFIGPSDPTTTCAGSGGPAVSVRAIDSSSPSAPSHGSSTSTSNGSGGDDEILLPKPSGVQNTHVLIAAITINNSIRVGGSGNVDINPPAGWTHIRTTNNGNTIGLATYYKVITDASSEPGSSYSFSFRSASTGNPITVRATGGISRFTGVDTTDPIDVDGGNTGSDNSGTINATASAITTTRNNVALLAVHAMANGSGGSSTAYFSNWTNSMSERFDRRGSSSSGPSIALASKTDSSAGSTGSTRSNVAGGGSYAAQHIALRPDFTNHYGTTYPNDLAKWIPIGFTSTDGDTPAQTWNEAYVDADGNLQNGTHIVSAINCFDNPGGTGTNLTTPIAMAAAYLQAYGRPNVKWGILFETDGEPSYGSTGDPGNYTCQSAVDAATAAKAITNANGQHIELFTVGFFDSGSDPDCPDNSGTYDNKNVSLALSHMATSNFAPSPNGTSNGCVATENTDSDHFFCQPKTEDLADVFSVIATEFAGIRTHLIQLSPPPYVNTISPTSGGDGGGTVVTITGKYFTGTSSVKFGGVNASFTVTSDTEIVATAPAGTDGESVQIIVTNDGGSSLPHSGSRFTYD